MFDFGNRRVNKQGGSFMIALPMKWVRSIGKNTNIVNIKMDNQYKLIVIPATESVKNGGK